MRGIREEDIAIQENRYGPTADRTKEHPGTSDAGLIATRRRLLKAMRHPQAGREPPEPRSGHVYRVHPVAGLFPRDVAFDDVTRAAMPIAAAGSTALTCHSGDKEEGAQCTGD